MLLTIWLSGALFKIDIFIPPNDSFIGSKMKLSLVIPELTNMYVYVLMLFNFGNHKCK